MKIIFVDMDGVITDFNRRFTELFSVPPGDETINISNSKKSSTKIAQWNEFIDNQHFSSLDWHQGGEKLVEYLKSINVQKCILSSSGGFERNRDVASQKYKWLTEHKIDWPVVIVPGRKYKAGFANGNSFIIDDMPDVIKSFCANGGNGIVHKDVDTTIGVVSNWIDPKYSTPWI